MSILIVQQKLLDYHCQTVLEQENALKEIVQEIALMALSRAGFFKIAAFQGGTCLRILYGLERFSEDLDFMLEQPDKNFSWTVYANALAETFVTYGFTLEFKDRNKIDNAVKMAFLKTESTGGMLIIKDLRTNKPRLNLKLEIDSNPPEHSLYELKYLDFPLPFSVKTQDLSSLFASKCHALLCRPYTKGRDWYDFTSRLRIEKTVKTKKVFYFQFVTSFFCSLTVVTRCGIVNISKTRQRNQAGMYIRKRKNRGGSTSIMLLTGERKPGKKHVHSRMIKNFGSSCDEEELNKLIQQAEEYKQHLMLISPKASTLKITSPRDIKSCLSFTIGFLDVYGKFFDKIFSQLNLKSHELKKLRDLSVMRIANPASKRKTAMISRDYGIDCNVDSIYKFMDQLTENIATQAKKIIYNHSTELLSKQKETVDVMFYDLTTVYFETNSDDSLRNFGFSKDGKCQHVQIMLAVIVTKHGLPIDYEEFPGNCYEGHTLIPVIEKIKIRYNIDKTVLVADAALMNKINLSVLTEKKINYIIAARVKNMKKETQENILDKNEYQTIYSSKTDEISFKKIKLPDDDTLIAYNSSKRAKKDAYDREKAIDKIQQYLNSTAKSQLTSRLKKPYVKVSKGAKIEIDFDKLNREKQFDGFFGIQTNLEEINAKEILSTYRGLWQVEQTFRIAKSNLEIRPVFHYNSDRIRAHFLICYMSLALIRYVEFELRKNNLHYPIDQLHLLLNQMRVTKVHHADSKVYVLLEDPPPELLPIYRALNIPWHKKFSQEVAVL